MCNERAALVGPNGSGKTTFLKDVIEKAKQDTFCIRIGPSLTLGYCAQNQEIFNTHATIIEEFQSLGPGTKNDVFSVLSRFLFTWEDMDKRIGNLSGGEKNRLQLARLMILKANFLILDEPTNHMDIPSREAIEESLSSFNGTILVVSHDRYFLDKVATSIVEIRNGKFNPFYGNFSEFWAAKENLAKEMGARVSTRSRQYRKSIMHLEKDSNRGGLREDRSSRIELRISELEKQKLKVEGEITRVFSVSATHVQGRKLSGNLEKLTRRIDKLYEEWERELDGK